MAVPPPLLPSIDDKPALRARLRRARAAQVAALRDGQRLATATAAACTRLADHVPPGTVVALYHALGDELDPRGLAGALAARGHALALPHLGADGVTMTFRAWHPDDAVATGARRFAQPADAAPSRRPDLIVLPLVGFDRRGGRIGQGAGCYDRALAALPGARRIGLAWSSQEAGSIPLDPWDLTVDAVCTEREWIPCAAPAR